MHCVKCGRRLKRAAAYTPSPNLAIPMPVGPVCARRHGLLSQPTERAKKAPAARTKRQAVQHAVDPRQIDWVGVQA